MNTMKKVVKKYGDAFVIRLTKEEREIYGIKEGSIVDLTDLVVLSDREVDEVELKE